VYSDGIIPLSGNAWLETSSLSIVLSSAGISGIAKNVKTAATDSPMAKDFNRAITLCPMGAEGFSVHRLITWQLRGGDMNVKMAGEVLLWCGVINYGLLLIWFLFFVRAHAWLYRITGRWFRLSVEQFDALNYLGIAVYKIGIILLNMVPYVALRIIG
jgi:hypothetical protein